MNFFKLVIAGGLVVSTVPALAAPTVWINDSNANLARVNAVTGVASLVGNTGLVLSDIAFDSAGKLFGASASALYSIDKATAAMTEIGRFADGVAIDGLGFDAHDTLYATGGTSLWSIDTTDGHSTLLGSTGFTSGDIAVQHGRLYITAGGSSSDRLVRLKLLPTVSGASLGATGKVNLAGLINGGGTRLYAVGFKTIYRVDLAGASTAISTNYTYLGAGSALGAASDSIVPEPATWTLMGVGFGAVGYSARRRRPPGALA